eukprot:3496854-Rhodomonas_salina.2
MERGWREAGEKSDAVHEEGEGAGPLRTRACGAQVQARAPSPPIQGPCPSKLPPLPSLPQSPEPPRCL